VISLRAKLFQRASRLRKSANCRQAIISLAGTLQFREACKALAISAQSSRRCRWRSHLQGSGNRSGWPGYQSCGLRTRELGVFRDPIARNLGLHVDFGLLPRHVSAWPMVSLSAELKDYAIPECVGDNNDATLR